jgi:putative FmdB family regulatory protein
VQKGVTLLMPTYRYRCTVCHHEFEEFQSITDDPIDSCPLCKAKAERLISGGAGLLFKGSGFYITDYRSEKYKKEAAKESGDKKDSSSKSGSTDKGTSQKKD